MPHAQMGRDPSFKGGFLVGIILGENTINIVKILRPRVMYYHIPSYATIVTATGRRRLRGCDRVARCCDEVTKIEFSGFNTLFYIGITHRA